MTSSVLRIAALLLLGTPGICAAASPAAPSLVSAEDLGVFCGGIYGKANGAGAKVTYQDIEVTVDAGKNISLMQKGVLVKQIKSAEYSTYAQCIKVTLAAIQQYAK